MPKVTLTTETGENLRGSLGPLKGPPMFPAALGKVLHAGSFYVGTIHTPRGDLLAVYTIEAAANEADIEIRKCHAAWMKARGAKPEDIEGFASNQDGTTLYRFRSDYRGGGPEVACRAEEIEMARET
jgi:hypothetical protein